jgi:hypothetical protein
MSTEQTIISDPRSVVSALNADAISARLDELDGEAEALRVLLRAARARERSATQAKMPPRKQSREVAVT